jgi:hypothetical protein
MTNALLTAGAPEIIQILKALQSAVSTITTGDPATVGLRIGPAFAIFDGQVALILPSLATAELSAVGASINTGIGGWITKLTPAA